jgi:hypothetical protein
MRKLALAVTAVGTLLTLPSTTFAQGFYFGPGGVRVDDGRDYYRERRYRRSGYEDCRELRQACLHKEELGEEGRGNCRRYRETCR